MNLKPLGERVILEIVEKEEKTSGGIVIPDSAKEMSQEGKVLAVGPGKVLNDGTKVAVDVKEGDRVIFSKFSGSEIKVDGKDYLIVRQDDILAVHE